LYEVPDLIDLRSDTVTRPTPEMRAAMAAAEVGDDVYGEDPTINLLERRAAEIFGREAGLFVPTGTMGNQVALRCLTQPGQEIICEAKAHILDWEMATAAVFSGCMIRAVPTRDGILTWKDIEPVIYKWGGFRAATGAIEMENTHNMAGGGGAEHGCEDADTRIRYGDVLPIEGTVRAGGFAGGGLGGVDCACAHFP
jgi:threonine aldolase